jgi:hypothetical protein
MVKAAGQAAAGRACGRQFDDAFRIGEYIDIGDVRGHDVLDERLRAEADRQANHTRTGQ